MVAVAEASQLTAGVFAGPAIDRFGPRLTLGARLVLQSIGFGLMPLVRSPWQAFLLRAPGRPGSGRDSRP